MKKHILCFGDSNTHGKCADPKDCADSSRKPLRFNEDERWPMLLAKALGEDYLVIEEGLSGRTTVFQDPIHDGLAGLKYLEPCLLSHAPLDALICMLGTNDVKDRFSASPTIIGKGMDRLIREAKALDCWADAPNILLVCPAPYSPMLYQGSEGASMGQGTVEKSELLAAEFAKVAQAHGCAFLDANGIAIYNTIDYIHLTAEGHRRLSAAIRDELGRMGI